MYKRLYDFFRKKKTIYNSQFGFQQSKSTEHAILTLYKIVIQSIEKIEKSNCIFFDFAKEFDTVDDKILIEKLNYYEIRRLALRLFESYLASKK